ncbi:MAG: hypothetical protein ABIL09_16855, partial [Gemmatimonadota bacterium]
VAGCASPQLLLENRGDLYLARGGEEVRVAPDDELAITWRQGEAERSTADLVAAARRPLRARLVEANDQYVRVRADAWRQPHDIPSALLGPEVQVIARSGRYKRPTLLIPTAGVTEVEIYALLPRRQRPRWRDVAIGAGGGFTSCMVGFAAEPNPLWPDQDVGTGYFLGSAAVGAAGAIVYPVYRMFRPRWSGTAVHYGTGQSDGWQLRARPPR